MTENNSPEKRNSGTWRWRFALFGFLLATIFVLVVILAGPGTRLGLWNFRTGLSMVLYGGIGGAVGALISLIGCILTRPGSARRGFSWALFGLLIGLAGGGYPLSKVRKAFSSPPIHDITTDIDNPPQFKDVLPLRKGALNKAEYGGPEVAALQRKGYPDIGPLILQLSPDQTFERALRTAREMNWEIDGADQGSRLIEATDTTFWFGFKDDIVIRLTPTENGSTRVDVRSVSRVGGGDIGTNAERIRNFLKRLQQQERR